MIVICTVTAMTVMTVMVVITVMIVITVPTIMSTKAVIDTIGKQDDEEKGQIYFPFLMGQ
jgi:competence protein ComGC